MSLVRHSGRTTVSSSLSSSLCSVLGTTSGASFGNLDGCVRTLEGVDASKSLLRLPDTGVDSEFCGSSGLHVCHTVSLATVNATVLLFTLLNMVVKAAAVLVIG